VITGPAPVLVWIDAERATIAEWREGDAQLHPIESSIPPHRRSTAHVRHEPTVRHGGGGPDDGEAHRLEHVRRFLAEVADALPKDAPVRILGPGTMPRRLATVLEERDRHASRIRAIECIAAARLTDRQLAAELREAAGAPVPRQRPAGG
jgi:hypothetical protein